MSVLPATANNNIDHVLATANIADSTRRKYQTAVYNYLATGSGLTDQHALAAHAADLSNSGRAHLKAAVTLWTKEMATAVKGNVTPETVNEAQAMIMRLEALPTVIKVKAAKGQKAHTWLSQAQVKKLMELPDTSGRSGRRDKIALGLCVSAGLRREEAVSVAFDDFQLLPMGNRFRTVINVKGKGAKDRAVPISDSLAAAIEAWHADTGDGFILRSVAKGGKVGSGLTAVSLFRIVAKYGRLLGVPELAPHDLRRTYAQLGYEAGVAITQVSKLLGHANVATTQRYLNLELNIETTISDFIPY